jgi:hypothetical protein
MNGEETSTAGSRLRRASLLREWTRRGIRGRKSTGFGRALVPHEAYRQGSWNVRVAPNGSGTACTAAAPCSQSTGYAKLASGDTLFFTSGTYRQSATFTVGKSAVTLTADPVQPPAVLTGDTDDDGIAEVPAQGSWSSLVRITSDDVVFENSRSAIPAAGASPRRATMTPYETATSTTSGATASTSSAPTTRSSPTGSGGATTPASSLG